MDEFGHALAFGRGADDDTEVFGTDALDELAEAHFLFRGLDFL